MSKELIVNSSVHETRLAILEDDRLVELYIEQESQHALAGSIFKGRVTRVLPGMQSAFVDIGLERDAFLYVSDFLDENEDLETAPADATPRRSEGSSEDEPAEPNAKADSTDRLANAGADTQSAAPEEKAPTDGNLARRGGRGRRPRRRRGRSGEGSAAGSESGFPEEKYAPIDGDEQPKDTEPAAVVDPPVKQESDFIVLPGESLAKYSGPTTSEEPTPDDDAPRIARARDENVEASVERDGVPADDTDSDVDAAVEETNSSPEGPAGEGLDLSSEDIAAEELPEPVTPVEIVVVEDDGEAFLASERSPELHNEVVVDRRTNTVPTGETGEPATVTEDAAGEGVENEAEEVPQEPGGSEEQPAGEPESGEEVAAGAAEAPAAGSEDAGPTDEGPRVPGRPLPADEENDERQAAPEPGEDSGRPQEGEVRHRTRSTSASFERRRGRRGRRRDDAGKAPRPSRPRTTAKPAIVGITARKSATCSPGAKKCWSRFLRNRSGRRARASRRTSLCRALSGLHADSEPHRSLEEDRLGQGAGPPTQDRTRPQYGHARRLHCPYGRRRGDRRGPAWRHALPLQPLARHPRKKRALPIGVAGPSRR